MEITVDFPGGSRVDAHFNSFTVSTDQPREDGGGGAAPAPFELFLTSLVTCAGYYVLEFCRARGIDTGGIRLKQWIERNETTYMVEKISMEIQLPEDFPQKYARAVIRAAEKCSVKKHMEYPPSFDIRVAVADPVSE
ncbi:MAG: OsmC family protein [Acidobacteria bacterium]|nr:OsmC family protein [Acidobacteriota bacterium]